MTKYNSLTNEDNDTFKLFKVSCVKVSKLYKYKKLRIDYVLYSCYFSLNNHVHASTSPSMSNVVRFLIVCTHI